MDARILEIIKTVDLEETVFEIGLRSAVGAVRTPGLEENILHARDTMRERLGRPELMELVERFDPRLYNRNATMAERGPDAVGASQGPGSPSFCARRSKSPSL